MNMEKGKGTISVAIVGALLVAVVLIVGTFWMGKSAKEDTEKAVRSVSLLYLDELAGRREQVVASNLQNYINYMDIAVSLLDEEDTKDEEHLRAYQTEIKKLFNLNKFAFVDNTGLIHTALGTRTDIDQYAFDYKTIREPEISIKDLDSDNKKVVIAMPVGSIALGDKELVVCFIEMDVEYMLQGVSMKSSSTDATFCNIYSKEGIPLTSQVLGGEAQETGLYEALESSDMEKGYSLAQVREDFENEKRGVVSFVYHGIRATLSYVPVEGTDWMLTYLIRESLITEKISSVSNGIITRSVIQSILTALVLLIMFSIMIAQNRKQTALMLEKETAEAESRVKHQELEQRLALQGQLLEQEKQRTQQDNMITALASDYRSVYYINLDKDEGVCYRTDAKMDEDAVAEGEHFPYYESFAAYADRYVDEKYKEEFLSFIKPEKVRAGLEKEPVVVIRYLVHRDGKDAYEMLRMAAALQGADQADDRINKIGVGFSDIDQDMRESLAKSQALSDALAAAEESNKAKTAFLSNMSHEIRTPMNAIIGLDNIALNDPDISDRTRDYLKKIGESAQHLLGLINDILDMSRVESGRLTIKKEEFAFFRLIEQVNVIFSDQCREKGLNYHCQVQGHLDDYYIGDDMKLRQVLINILGNAVKFTPPGGSVDFAVERTARFNGKTTIEFVIKDTGIGISEEFLPHLFDTFSQEDSSTTSKYGSSGLGMAITKSIVEMMNGHIQVQSKKGEGTTFTVAITLLDSNRKMTEEDRREIRPEELSVLIIDDDPIACEHGKLVLGNVGIASETAHSGAEAIEMIRLRHARRSPYNLILVDWRMPDMDGVETTRKIRSLIGNESAIIILTAYKWDDVQEEALEAGVDSFLAKPLFAGAAVEEFRTAIKKKNIINSGQESKADLTGRRILLAEDMAVNAEIMIMVLQMREMEVEHALNGKIAVDMFSSHEEGYYDAILMDMRMPEMDGLEATRTIRSLDRPDAKTIPIIALTANAFDEDVQRSLQAGLNAHLSKPVEPENLYDTLETLIQ